MVVVVVLVVRLAAERFGGPGKWNRDKVIEYLHVTLNKGANQ